MSGGCPIMKTSREVAALFRLAAGRVPRGAMTFHRPPIVRIPPPEFEQSYDQPQQSGLVEVGLNQ